MNRKKEVKKKQLKQNLLLLLTIIIIFFVIFEIVLRLFSYPIYGFQKGVFVYDEVLGYKLSPNYSGTQSIYGRTFELQTNSNGLRDKREYKYEKEPEIFRIVLLGDSMTFGNGVNLEETYPEYLRQEFSKNKMPVEIINLAVPGYGINHEYLSFIEEGQKYEPDLILIGYVTNDWGLHKLSEKNGKLVVNEEDTLIANGKGLLVSRSEKFGFRSIHLFLLFNVRTYSFIYTKSRLILSKIVNKYWISSAGIPSYLYKNDSLEYKECYEGYSSVLKMLKQKTSVPIVIFLGPFQDYLTTQEDIKKEYGIDYYVNPKQTQESVAEIANKLNISVIKIESDDPTIFIKVDGHWNAKGNKMISEKLFSELKPLIEKEQSKNS